VLARRTAPSAASNTPFPKPEAPKDEKEGELSDSDEYDEGNDDANDHDDPFMAALQKAHDKKKLIERELEKAKGTPSPSATKYKAINAADNNQVEQLSAEMAKKLTIDDEKDEDEDDSDDGPVKSFQFAALKK